MFSHVCRAWWHQLSSPSCQHPVNIALTSCNIVSTITSTSRTFWNSMSTSSNIWCVSIISCQHFATSPQHPARSCQHPKSHQIPASSSQHPTTSHQLPTTSQKHLATSHQHPATSYWHPIIKTIPCIIMSTSYHCAQQHIGRRQYPELFSKIIKIILTFTYWHFISIHFRSDTYYAHILKLTFQSDVSIWNTHLTFHFDILYCVVINREAAKKPRNIGLLHRRL